MVECINCITINHRFPPYNTHVGWEITSHFCVWHQLLGWCFYLWIYHAFGLEHWRQARCFLVFVPCVRAVACAPAELWGNNSYTITWLGEYNLVATRILPKLGMDDAKLCRTLDLKLLLKQGSFFMIWSLLFWTVCFNFIAVKWYWPRAMLRYMLLSTSFDAPALDSWITDIPAKNQLDPIRLFLARFTSVRPLKSPPIFFGKDARALLEGLDPVLQRDTLNGAKLKLFFPSALLFTQFKHIQTPKCL